MIQKVLIILFLFSVSLTNGQNSDIGGTPVNGIKTIQRVYSNKNNNSTFKTSSLSPRSRIVADSPTGLSSEIGLTQGDISVSLSGAAIYNVPIQLPLGINGTTPEIGITYNSQSGNGNAGYGWNLSGISKISITGSSNFYDKKISTTQIGNDDRFILDGQRLILKNGTYGHNDATYVTESNTNIKITSKGRINNQPEYFILEYPDGSKATYTGKCDNQEFSFEWKIASWTNPNGLKINYSYHCIIGNNLYLSSIEYNNTNINSKTLVEFIYQDRLRQEKSEIGAHTYIDYKLIKDIKITNNNIAFKNYNLQYEQTSLGYERLKKIIEKNGDLTKSLNPIVFSYEDSNATISYKDIETTLSVSNLNYKNSNTISGDFDGDGSRDIILYPTTGTDAKKKYWYYSNLANNNTNIGFEHNVGNFREIFQTSWLNHGDKLMPMQGWCVVKHDTNSNLTNFSNYSMGTTNPIYFQYDKLHEFPKFQHGYWQNPCIDSTPNNISNSIDDFIEDPNEPLWVENSYEIPKIYFSGDFDGDNLTDILVIEKDFNYLTQEGCYNYTNTYKGGKVYLVKLDRRKTVDFVSIIGNINFNSSSKIYIEDINGDGKSDILVFDNGAITPYTLDIDNKQLQLQYKTQDSRIIANNPVYFGDYNGDGQMDFIIPKGTGNKYTKFESYTFSFSISDVVYDIPYKANTATSTTTDIYYIIPADYNQDGKTDLIFAQNKHTRNLLLPQNSKGFIKLTSYKNTGTNFVQEMQTTSSEQTYISAYATPVFLDNNKSTLKSELNFITNNRIIHFESQKDFSKDKLLRTITLGNGVKTAINYSSLKYIDPYSYEDYIYHPSSYTEQYPNYDITASNNFQIVSSLEIATSNSYKKQNYKYYGAVSSVDGKGFLGFRAIAKTNWFNDDFTPITTLTKFDIDKKGTPSEIYTFTGEIYGNISNPSPSNYISKTILNYDYVLNSDKTFKLNNTSSIEYDGLNGTSVETNTIYDTFNNPTTIVKTIKNGNTTELIETSELDYENSTKPYIVGRLKSKFVSTLLYENGSLKDTKTSEENYAYTGNNITQVKRKGHLTNFITEDLVYDIFGNITKKTISGVGLKSRSNSFEYDLSGRYLLKSIDPENINTSYDYDYNTGNLLSITDSFGAKTQYTYDSWGNKIQTTDYLGNKTYFSYTKTNSGRNITLSVTNDEGSFSQTEIDELGRIIKSSTKTINDKHSTISKQYDIYNREISVSQPFDGTSTSATLFTNYSYDLYGRPSSIAEATGKTTSFSYSPSTTISNDGIKTITTVKNALGLPKSVTDNGGTINYSYDAQGNLLKSDFEGNIIELEYDGWGRKSKLNDPSAGVYEYHYNEFGELKTAINPKGSTNYTIDDFGKIIEKTIIGITGTDQTNSKVNYTYNTTTKLLEKLVYEDYSEAGHKIEYNYNYDNYGRIIKSNELNQNKATFEKQFTYDTFGRLLKEYYYASNVIDGTSSSQWIKNTYKNGSHYQIFDDSKNRMLWQTNEVNANGQLISASYGNGIKIANTYDKYGFLNKTSHTIIDDNSTTGGLLNIMTLVNTFDPITANLKNRTNSIFNTQEAFVYDNLDRLVEWSGANRIIYNLKFISGVEVFDGINSATVQNDAERLKITASNPNSGAQKKLIEKAVAGDKYKIKFTFDDGLTGTNNYKTKVVIVEENISTGLFNDYTLTAVNEGIYEAEHIIQNDNANVYVKIIKDENISGQIVPRSLYIDNLFFIKTGGVDKQFYDNKGRITQNVLGEYQYTDINGTLPKIYRNTLINTTLDATQYYKKYAKQDITYNVFKSPLKIEEQGTDKLSFLYNAFDTRSAMYYGSQDNDKNLRPKRKFYAADGTMEIKYDVSTNKSEFITYIGGDGYSAPIILKSDGTSKEFLYLHRDYLGSITTITNDLAETVESRSFDAWGNIVSIKDKNGNEIESLGVLDRGYTGHEHLQSVGLINMNGRIYDPLLHRFLQPDNDIQNPFNTQNYNRYGYVMNNPLKYNDINGENYNYPGGYNGTWQEGELSNTEQSTIGNLIGNLVQNWDELGIKNWANRNIGLKQFGNVAKSSGKWIERNAKSVGKWFQKQWKSIFGGGKPEKVYLPSTPSFTNHQLTSGWQNEGFQSGVINYTGNAINSQWLNIAKVIKDTSTRINYYFPQNAHILANSMNASEYAFSRYHIQQTTRAMLTDLGKALSNIAKTTEAQLETAKYYAYNNKSPSGNLRGGINGVKFLRGLGVVALPIGVGASIYKIYSSENKSLALSHEIGGWAGAAEGAAFGAAYGSMIGPWGTLIGGVVGGAIGYWAGGYTGEVIYNTIKP